MNSAEQAARAPEQVLLVDDNPTNLQVLYKTLDGIGYTLLAAQSGEQALTIARKTIPSLILLDIMMPEMDGFEVCRRLKEEEATAGIPVIFLSALTDTEAKVQGFTLGAVDYISKPFQSDEVRARVRTQLRMHRLEMELARRNVELEDENRKILSSVAEAIIGLDDQGRIGSMNQQAELLTGWKLRECLGEPLATLGLFNEHLDEIKQALREHQLIEFDELTATNRRGEEMTVAMYCSPREGGGTVLVLRDITEWLANQKALEAAREELDRQRQHLAHMERLSTGGEMAAGIAHEVNQPLTAVSNYARVAQRMLENGSSLDRAKLDEVMGKIMVQSKRASDVIQRLRSYIRKPTTEGSAPVDINTVMQEVVSLAEVDARINKVNVSFEPTDNLPAIMADEVQVQQVALNLIRNAMEAMRDAPEDFGGVKVRSFEESGDVGFTVEDRGCGLSPEMEQQLFSPFVTTKEGGMGVGLSICQAIVQSYGGSIGYRPNPKGGAIFYCQFPPA